MIPQQDLFGEMRLRCLDEEREQSARRKASYASSSTRGPHVNFDGHFQTHESDMQWWPSDFVDQGRTACAAYDIYSSRIADEKSLLLLILACELILPSSITKHWMRRCRKRRACEPTHFVLYGGRNKHSIVSYSFWQTIGSRDIHVLGFGKTSRKAGTCSVGICNWEGGGRKAPWSVCFRILRKSFERKCVMKVRVGRRKRDIYTPARCLGEMWRRSNIIALDA